MRNQERNAKSESETRCDDDRSYEFRADWETFWNKLRIGIGREKLRKSKSGIERRTNGGGLIGDEETRNCP